MFTKEDKVKYFVGGTAVGVAAGLVIGKFLLSTPSPVRTTNIEPRAVPSRNIKQRVQDDNVYGLLHPHKNIHCHQPRSKSASRYEDKKSKEHSSSTDLLTKLLNSEDNINNLTSKRKFNKIKDGNLVRNISIEDNIGYSLCERDASASIKVNNQCSQKEKANNACNASTHQLGLRKNNADQLPGTPISCKIINSENRDIGEENTMKHCTISKYTKILSDDCNIDGNTLQNNLDNKSSSKLHFLTLDSENCSNVATYNYSNDTYFKAEGGDWPSFVSFEELNESNLISSTKCN